MKMKKISTLFILFLLSCSVGFSAIQVLNTNDTGEGSLRVALQEANSNPGPDSIKFAIPMTDPNYDSLNGWWTLSVHSTLPTVTDDSLTIDGLSQHAMNPEAPADMPLIILSGYGIEQESHGLLLWSAYNSVNNICIGGFRGAHIWIKGQWAHHNAVQGCYIGVYPDGQTGFGDAQNPEFGVESSRGVYISNTAFENRIGGTDGQMRNIICNMYNDGILIDDADGNIVQGNYIGVLKDGTTPLGNGWIDVPKYNVDERPIRRYYGVSIHAGSASNIIGGAEEAMRNLVCASGRSGILIWGEGADSNIVSGNYIGIGADGFAHDNLGNAESGLKILRGAQNNIIGGEEQGAGNVISGNRSSGVQIRENVSQNILAGNIIGLSADGTALVPNEHSGIYLFGQTSTGFPQNNLIGPGNVIIPNGEETSATSYAFTWAAVRLDSSGTAFNRIFGNWLGTDKTGLLGSDYNSGVIISSGAHDNVVGPENVIARTKRYGVWIRLAGTDQNTITANSYSENLEQHIFLSDSGNALVQPPQNLLVAPDSLSGTCMPFGKVELYIDDGATFVDSVFADENGNFVWKGQTNEAVFLATATDPAGNTSEFSISKPVPVELTAFTAKMIDKGILLAWRTESESNNLGFYVQKGTPDFRDIAFIPGYGTTAEPHDYTYLDDSSFPDGALYRLRQVDFDGAVSLSDAIAVESAAPHETLLRPPFPNPFNGETVLYLDLIEDSDALVRVFNLRGQETALLFRGHMNAGTHRLVWNGRTAHDDPAPSGLYFIRAKVNKNKIFLHKVIFVR